MESLQWLGLRSPSLRASRKKAGVRKKLLTLLVSMIYATRGIGGQERRQSAKAASINRDTLSPHEKVQINKSGIVRLDWVRRHVG